MGGINAGGQFQRPMMPTKIVAKKPINPTTATQNAAQTAAPAKTAPPPKQAVANANLKMIQSDQMKADIQETLKGEPTEKSLDLPLLEQEIPETADLPESDSTTVSETDTSEPEVTETEAPQETEKPEETTEPEATTETTEPEAATEVETEVEVEEAPETEEAEESEEATETESSDSSESVESEPAKVEEQEPEVQEKEEEPEQERGQEKEKDQQQDQEREGGRGGQQQEKQEQGKQQEQPQEQEKQQEPEKEPEKEQPKEQSQDQAKDQGRQSDDQQGRGQQQGQPQQQQGQQGQSRQQSTDHQDSESDTQEVGSIDSGSTPSTTSSLGGSSVSVPKQASSSIPSAPPVSNIPEAPPLPSFMQASFGGPTVSKKPAGGITAEALQQAKKNLIPVSQNAVLTLGKAEFDDSPIQSDPSSGKMDQTVIRSAQSIRAKTGGSVFDRDMPPGEKGTLSVVGHGVERVNEQGQTEYLIGDKTPQQLVAILKDAGVQKLDTLSLKSCHSTAFMKEVAVELKKAGIEVKQIEGFDSRIAIDEKTGETLTEANGVNLDQVQGHSGNLGKGLIQNQWYTDADIWSVLQAKTVGQPNVHVMAPISTLELPPNSTLLADFLVGEYFQLREANPAAEQAILIPFNVGNNHWVALRLDLNVMNTATPVRVSFMDSLGEAMPAALRGQLDRFLNVTARQEQIQATDHLIQNDNHSCGPMTIENLLDPHANQNLVEKDPADIRDSHQELVPNVGTSVVAKANDSSSAARIVFSNAISNLKPDQLKTLQQAIAANDITQAHQILQTIGKPPIEKPKLAQKISEVLFDSSSDVIKWKPEIGDMSNISFKIIGNLTQARSASQHRSKLISNHPLSEFFAACENPKLNVSQRVAILDQAFVKMGIEIPKNGAAPQILERMRDGAGTEIAYELLGDHDLCLKPCEIGETYHILAACVLIRGTDTNPQIFREPNGPNDQGDNSVRQRQLADSVFESYKNLNPKWSIETQEHPHQAFSDSNINAQLLAPFFIAEGPLTTSAKIRERFLNDADTDGVTQFIGKSGISLSKGDQAVVNPDIKRAAIWLSSKQKDKWVDLVESLPQMLAELKDAGITEVIFMGDMLSGPAMQKLQNACQDAGVPGHNLTNFYKNPVFSASMSNQLQLIDTLYRQGGLVCNIGNKSGAMDGATLIGVPQIFLEQVDDPKAAPFTRIGFSAMVSPFWNQIPTDGEHISKGAIFEQTLNCLGTRTWQFQSEIALAKAEASKSKTDSSV